MTKKEAIKDFNENIKPFIPKGDKPALCEAWNNWTDSLCKDRVITPKQYSTWVHPF